MKNKILMIGGLAMIFVFAVKVHALDQNSNGEAVNQTRTEMQTQQQFQDESEIDNQIQVQNQTQNQEEENQIQDKEQEAIQETVEQRRSQVANAAQEMIRVAEGNSGIGQQVRVIAQAQIQNQEKLEQSLQKIQSRSGFSKFFVGANYDEINNAKEILEKNREQIEQLDQVKNQLGNQSDQQALTEQVRILEQVDLKNEDSLRTAQKGFSLFGWMFKLFSR